MSHYSYFSFDPAQQNSSNKVLNSTEGQHSHNAEVNLEDIRKMKKAIKNRFLRILMPSQLNSGLIEVREKRERLSMTM